jgi:hypothetical protein
MHKGFVDLRRAVLERGLPQGGSQKSKVKINMHKGFVDLRRAVLER